MGCLLEIIDPINYYIHTDGLKWQILKTEDYGRGIIRKKGPGLVIRTFPSRDGGPFPESMHCASGDRVASRLLQFPQG